MAPQIKEQPKTHSHKIDIVIVNWNSGQWLQKCLSCIFNGDHQELVSKVIVVDNHSTDTSLQNVSDHPCLMLIANTTNKGFAAACNQGIRQGISEYVVMVNPDVLVESETIAKCFQFMEANPEVDICGVRQNDESGLVRPSCARFPTALAFFNDASGFSKLAPKLFRPATLMTDWDHLSSKKVDQIMGSFMFIRRKTLSRIGLFDERFFVYYEELDLSKRLRLNGGVSFYNHTISLIHGGGGTTNDVKAFRLYLSLKSRLQYCHKHFSMPALWFTYFTTFGIEFFSRLLFSLSKSGVRGVREVALAYTWLLIGKPNFNR